MEDTVKSKTTLQIVKNLLDPQITSLSNLLYECVKIVEVNFNSHVFLIIYQEIRFLNQVACFFLIKKRDDRF